MRSLRARRTDWLMMGWDLVSSLPEWVQMGSTVAICMGLASAVCAWASVTALLEGGPTLAGDDVQRHA